MPLSQFGAFCPLTINFIEYICVFTLYITSFRKWKYKSGRRRHMKSIDYSNLNKVLSKLSVHMTAH